ncbi:HYR domain-containing protein [Parvicella tangerina]|uniref:HYR domain-containing protein n=1 Tax=Parvicella tangerina TaxID=2829795 RepID=A0A916JLY1_9FLAO|nr:HYR domain-containing protein [Parvicella tangerina]CAG5080813.1 hypothetical protein CRYO30217_01451 [Parvicella tangerina]
MKIQLLTFIAASFAYLGVFAQTPTLNCPVDINANNSNGNCGAIINYTIPTCASNCSGTTIYQSDNSGYTSGSFFPIGSYTIEYTISNGVDSSTCSFMINVNDFQSPTANLVSSAFDVYTDNNCEFAIPYFPDDPSYVSIFDNCTMDTVYQTPVAGTTISGVGTTVNIVLDAYDSTGNFISVNFDITLVDTLAPVISSCPGTITEPITTGCQAVLQDYTALVSVLDNCDGNPTVTQSPVSGTTFTTSEDVVIYAEDVNGNIDSCLFTVVSNDITAPSITCPNDTIVGVDANCDYLVADFAPFASAVDNCDPSVSFSQSPAVGSKLSGFNTSYFVSMTGSDVAGNSSVCSFEVTLIDTLAPVFTNCKDTTLYVDHNCELIMPNLFTFVGVSENCSSISTSQVPAPGSVISGETITNVFYTATDISSNSETCIMNVITVDTTSPNVVTCPSDMTVSTGSTSCDYEVVDFSSSVFATDNCSSSFSITQSESVGTLLPAGATYPITLTISDDAGNSSTCSFDITVEDNVSPDLSCLSNPSVPANSNCEYIIPSYDTVVNPSDNCGSVIFSQTPVAGTVISGIGTQQSISLFAEDAAGNQSSCSFTITVADTTSPDVTCPGTQSVAISGNCQYAIPDLSSLVTFSDLCDASPTYAQTPSSGTTVSGINTVAITVTDASGNTSTCSVQTQPDDVTPPAISCPTDLASCDSTFTYTTPVATDDCGLVSVAQTDATGLSSGDTFPTGITTLEYTATDDVGNTTTCSFNIEVYPTPEIILPDDILIEEGDSVQIMAAISNDSIFTWSPVYNMNGDTTTSPWVSPNSTVTYTLSAISYQGCSSSSEITVFVDQILEQTINNFLSPNGDGKNDTWNMSKPSLISGCNVTIYDRWGKLVWKSNAYNNQWDGKNSNGTEMPDGTYFYKISCDTQDDINGSILLMR